MILNSIDITNYRCFDKCSLAFTKAFNVLIGKNGSGKTAAVCAIKQALSFMFSNNKTLGESYLSAGLSTLNVRSFAPGDFRRMPDIEGVSDFASLACVASFNHNTTSHSVWELKKRSTSGAALQPSLYKDAFNEIASRYSAKRPLPVLAYFSDSFPHHNTRNTQQVTQMATPGSAQRNFGYYQWDDDDACMALWETRFCNILNESIQAKASDSVAAQHILDEQNAIGAALRAFSQKLSDDFVIDYFVPRIADGELALGMRFKNGQLSTLSDLPSGYRRLFSIVLDLLYRSWIINHTTDSTGIAIIDEIDLHLHPQLAQNIYHVLNATFPSIQFIVTSHSPLVIANLPAAGDNNSIIAFRNDHSPIAISNIYGFNYDFSLENVMGVKLRTTEVMSLVDSYVLLSEMGCHEEAARIRESLREMNIDDHQFASLINRQNGK